jgi:meiotic recombination protein SPO11
MDFDLVSRFINGHDTDMPPPLLTHLPDRGTLTPEQIAEHPTSDKGANQRGEVITKIEDIFESITDCILDEGKELVIPLKSRPKKKNEANKNDPIQDSRTPNAKARNITFPSRSPQEAWKFSK